jgi:hypothetical protein
MIATAMSHGPHAVTYKRVFSKNVLGANPGVRRFQSLVSEAWEAGFDPSLRESDPREILDTNKSASIGAVHAMFSYLGVR